MPHQTTRHGILNEIPRIFIWVDMVAGELNREGFRQLFGRIARHDLLQRLVSVLVPVTSSRSQ